MGEKMDIGGILKSQYFASLEILKRAASNARNHYGMTRERENKPSRKARDIPRPFFCFWFFRV
jgi:hypothetical protein